MGSKRVPPLVAREGEAREILLALADLHGVRNQIAALLVDKPDPANSQEVLPVLLRASRHRLGLTIMGMSAKCGLSRSVLSCFEVGTFICYKNPRFQSMLKLAYGYEIPFPIVVASAMRQMGLLPAPGAVELATSKRQRTPVQ